MKKYFARSNLLY